MGFKNTVIPAIFCQDPGHGLIRLRSVGQAPAVAAVQHHAFVHLHIIPEQAVHVFNPPRLVQIAGDSAQHTILILKLDPQREASLLRTLQNGADGLLPKLFPHRPQKQAGEGGKRSPHNRGRSRDLSF